MSDGRSGRRPLLLGLLGGTAALGAAAAAGRIAATLSHDDDGPGGDGGALLLTAESDDMAAATLALDDLLVADGAATWATPKLPTSTHSMVAVTWPGEGEPTIGIRSRAGGRWSSWQDLPVLLDGPDDASTESSAVRGTDLVWTGDADGVQVRVSGARPAGLTLTLLRPAPLPGDRTAEADVLPPPAVDAATSGATMRSASGGSARTAASLRPPLRSRAAWGADESLRERPASINSTIEQAHVHHSASGNTYTAADVPAIIRGFYRYHTGTLGWSDIAYNFLVDRFGRIWVGRAGGPDRAVRGAHTLGFNATSVGICVIGNFDTATPGVKVLTAVAAVAAWKLAAYDRNPRGWIRVTSEGSDKYAVGRSVPLHVIDGHRDTNDTACPGANLYARLPDIRARAAAMIAQGTTTPAVQATAPAVLSGLAVVGRQLRVTPGTYSPTPTSLTEQWLRNGTAIAGASGLTYRVRPEDIGTSLGVVVSAAAAGYTTAAQTLTTAVVRGRARVSSQVFRRRAGTRVKVRVHDRDTGRAGTGTVVVRARKTRRTATLRNGRATVVFPNLSPGDAVLAVTYRGDAAIAGGRIVRTVTIRP